MFCIYNAIKLEDETRNRGFEIIQDKIKYMKIGRRGKASVVEEL